MAQLRPLLMGQSFVKRKKLVNGYNRMFILCYLFLLSWYQFILFELYRTEHENRVWIDWKLLDWFKIIDAI